METIYKERFEQKKDELHDLYMQLYGNDAMFAELCEHLYAFYKERSEKLKKLDKKREVTGISITGSPYPAEADDKEVLNQISLSITYIREREEI